MTKTKNNKQAKETTSAPASAVAAPSERYERRDGIGFFLIKTSKDGVITETQLSNFTAKIEVENYREHEDSRGVTNRWLVSIEVSVRFRGQYLKAIVIAASDFRESLIDEILKEHPLIRIYPGKKEHVETAIIALSDDILTGCKRTSDKQLSAPRIIGKHGAEGKTNNRR